MDLNIFSSKIMKINYILILIFWLNFWKSFVIIILYGIIYYTIQFIFGTGINYFQNVGIMLILEEKNFIRHLIYNKA